MSSWSSTMPAPPPRSERSRSPSRGAYGRPPYSDPYADPYREHWDTYNRDRAWADYERDRGSYDHGRRGRSRSPPPDDSKFYLCKHPKWLITHIQQGANVAGLHLRMNGNGMTLDLVMRIMVSLLYILIAWKSLSLFSDGYRGHGHSPSRGRGSYGHGYGPRSGRGAPPPDPHSMDYPATLKQYADWFRYNFPQQASEEDSADKAAEQEAGDGSKPRNGIRTRWEKYKKEFLAQQVSHSRIILNQLSISALFWNNCFVNTMYTESVLYCSFRLCLIITESLLGLQRSMILHQNLQT